MRTAMRLLFTPMLFATTLAACADKGSDALAEAPAARSNTAAIPTKVANGDPDLQEVSDYRLTMDEIQKWSSITTKMNQIDFTKSSRPSNTSGDDADDTGRGGGGDNPSIDDLETLYNGNKQARELIASGGLDARDFVVITFIMMQAGLAQYTIDQGAKPDSVAKEMNVSLANLKFLNEHRSELDALGKGAR